MSYRVTFVMVMVAIVLAGLIFLRPNASGGNAGAGNPWFYLVDDTKIDQIDVTYFGRAQTYVRDDSRTWHVASLSGPAVSEEFQGTPFLAAGARSPRIITEEASDDDLARYDLTDPKISMRIRLETGESYRVHLGTLTPDRVNNYAVFEGSSGVYLVDRTWGEHMARLVTNPPLPTPTPGPATPVPTATASATPLAEEATPTPAAP